jgi:hypothetical protein
VPTLLACPKTPLSSPIRPPILLAGNERVCTMAGYAALLGQFRESRRGAFQRKQRVYSSSFLSHDRLELAVRLERSDKVILNQSLL